MLTVPVIIVMVIMYFFFADERAANRAAHEICPDTHVIRVDDQYRFGCDGHDYSVVCDEGKCTVEAL